MIVPFGLALTEAPYFWIANAMYMVFVIAGDLRLGREARPVSPGLLIVVKPTRVTNEIRRFRFETGEMTAGGRWQTRIGVTRQTVIAIEQGRYSPSLEMAFQIARVFRVAARRDLPLRGDPQERSDARAGTPGGHHDHGRPGHGDSVHPPGRPGSRHAGSSGPSGPGHRGPCTPITGGRTWASEGRQPTRWGMMRLRTVGRRSATSRVAILGYFEDGPNLVTMAMNGWGEPEPAWWLNLQAAPDTIVELVDGPRAVHGRAATRRRADSALGPVGRRSTRSSMPTPRGGRTRPRS